jgi:U3 small nucleolar RNA-associated protein 23
MDDAVHQSRKKDVMNPGLSKISTSNPWTNAYMAWNDNKRTTQKYLRIVLFNPGTYAKSKNPPFRPPLRIIPDATFLQHPAIRQLSSCQALQDLLEELCDCKVKLFTTTCQLAFLRQRCKEMGRDIDGESKSLWRAMELARGMEVLRHCCGQAGRSSPTECLQRAVTHGNPYRYSLATQEWALFGHSPDANVLVPIFYVDRGNHLNLRTSFPSLDKRTDGMMHVTEQERRLLQHLVPVDKAKNNKRKREERKRRRPSGPKAPNPLSCKKKKPKLTGKK